MENNTFQRPRGFYDILPADIPVWRYLEKKIRTVVERYGYREIRLPHLEKTELFARSIGSSTDIVEKEMFTIDQGKDEQSLSLRPEFTAPFARCVHENHLLEKKPFWKCYYLGPAFRYEKPQKGRLRQFHQMGVEVVGSDDPLLDVETIQLSMNIIEELGLSGLTLKVNTLGCPDCRPSYRESVRSYLDPKRHQLCENCQDRLDRNIFRVLDCDREPCQELVQEAPKIDEHLCERCEQHWDQVLLGLNEFSIDYVRDSRLGRGLDYYTKTIFEVIDPKLGAQNQVGGGGRYNRLLEEVGDHDAPAFGFAMGLERLILSLKERGLDEKNTESQHPDLFLVWIDRDCQQTLFSLAGDLREEGISVELNFEDRSVKGQMRAADHSNAPYVGILGPDEQEQEQLTIKHMESGEEERVHWKNIVNKLSDVS